MQEILTFVSNNGFAIVVAIYSLIYLNKSLSTMNETLVELKTIIENDKKDGEK